MTKMQYEDAYGKLTTMTLKRNSILGYLEYLNGQNEKYNGTLTYHGYWRTEHLEREICFTMGWVHEEAGMLHSSNKIVPDINDPRVEATLKNMEKKGHIKLSKSGRAYKILDTWRR